MPRVTGQSLERVRAAKKAAEVRLRKVPEVNGIGITRVGTNYGLKVNLSGPPRRASDLPAQINGVPIRIEVVGPIRARCASSRPALTP